MTCLPSSASPGAKPSRPEGGEAQPSALTAVITSASDGARRSSLHLPRHASPRRHDLTITAVKAGVAQHDIRRSR